MTEPSQATSASTRRLGPLDHAGRAELAGWADRTGRPEILIVTSRGLAAMNESNEFATAGIVPLGALEEARRADHISHGNRTDATEIPTVASQSVRP